MGIRKSALLAGLLSITVHTTAMAEPTASCRNKGQQALVALTQGDYEKVNRDFAPDVASKVTPESLRAGWGRIQRTAGTFKRLGDLQSRTVFHHLLLAADLEFSKATVTALIGCDAQDRIRTFRLMPPGELVATGAQPSAALPDAGVTRVLDVPSPFGPLPGTLLLPKGKGPFPVVLLLAGSGPNDRDETIGPNKPLRDMAEGLAASGIGSFRYDKRTHVYGKEAVTATLTVDDEVTDDALAALQLLARQPDVDPHRLFVLGHSLGAFMAPRVGQRNPRLAGLILLAAPAKMGPDVLMRQIRYLAPMQGASQTQLDQLLAPLIKTRDMLAHADPRHPPAGDFFHAPASYWLSLRDYDPIATARKLRIPMLVLQGGSDYQVTPHDDFSRWQAAFARDQRVKLVEYPGLSHLFMPAGQPPSAADYDKPGHVQARVLQDIVSWIKAVLP